jgi:hypothetical protein
MDDKWDSSKGIEFKIFRCSGSSLEDLNKFAFKINFADV